MGYDSLMELAEQIKQIILEVVDDATVFMYDPDSEHLKATVISESFKDISLLDRSRSIMKALQTNFASNLHSLQLQTYTPDEWQKKDRL